MKRFTLTILFVLAFFAARSQTNDNGALTWEDFVSLMADNSDEDSGPDQKLFDELYDLHCHPLNLNDIVEEDLYVLPFLTEDDVKNIMFHIDQHRPLMSTGELMFIYALDRQKRLMMQLFCYAGEYKKRDFSWKNVLRYSRSELVVRTDIPFYTKAGYKDVSDSILQKNPNKVYLGNRLYQSLRYNISSQDHIFAGFLMEKDAGEKYVDHFAGYMMLKNIGCIKSAIIGNYRISFGHGLVANTGSMFGKAMKLKSMDVIDRGITRQSSTSETGYLQGAATTLKFGKVKTSLFFSYKNADGTYNSDSVGLSSLKTDGLHRTYLERSKKNNLFITDYGANVHFDFNELQFSVTADITHLSVPLMPKYSTPSTYYKQYNLRGSNFSAYSVAYSYHIHKLAFSGETAISSSAAIATVDQLQWTPNSYNTLTLIYRKYGAKYNALNARAFGENSTVHNENGIYLGWNSELTSKLNISAYVDAMYFPWLKYQVYGSSYGIEGLTQLTYSLSDNHSFSIRYRVKSKQRDYTQSESSTLQYKTNHSLRIQYNLNIKDKWSLRTTLNGSYITFADQNNKGFSIGETIRYLGIKNLRLDLACIYFNTDSYDVRIYNYESSLLYTFAMNSYYYKGIRGTLLASWKILENLSLTVKFATTNYFNRNIIGTGLEQISANHREDLQLQFRWKF